MTWLNVTRWSTFVLVLMIGIAVLGIDGHITRDVSSRGENFPFEGLGIATACLTLLTLPVMLAVSAVAKNVFTSNVTVEQTWLFVLWVLWLATGSLAIADVHNLFPGGCNNYTPFFEDACRQLTAVSALSFVNWILLMLYSCAVVIVAIVAGNKGHSNAWTTDVTTLSGAGEKHPFQQQPQTTQV